MCHDSDLAKPKTKCIVGGVSGGHFLIFSIHLGVCVARGFIQFLYHSCVNLGNVDNRYLLLNYFQGHKQHATKLKTYECKEVRWIVLGGWLVVSLVFDGASPLPLSRMSS